MAEAAVLVVDDEPGVARLCERLLARAGYRVRSVTDPHQGLALLDDESFDLLLADIRMPGMDGFELMANARRRQPDLAVVVMTGFGTVETALETLRRGADGLILKPFAEAAELVRSVQHALQESRRKRDALRLETLRPLFDVTRTLFAETDPQRLQALLLDAVCGHLRCEHAGLYLFGSDRASFRLLARRGSPPGEEAAGLPGSPVRQAASSGVPLRAAVESGADPILAGAGFGSLVCAPVARADESLVLLGARNPQEAGLNEADLEMLVVLAHQAAVALENARLYAELRAYVRQVEESQRMLIQAEKMATAGRLTASIAHEINNPLQGVRNCLHLAGRPELSAAERQDYLNLAQEELERLMNTVQRMLDFYRPGARGRRSVDVNELIRRVLKLLHSELERRQIQVNALLSPEISQPLAVRDQIQQVLLNLLLNALEAMPERGRLAVETRPCPGGVEILVEDSGPGVPPGEAAHIFEPFVSTKENGTGLGLTVSYGIITAHGGSLELVLGRSQGACFRIFLPAERPAKTRPRRGRSHEG